MAQAGGSRLRPPPTAHCPNRPFHSALPDAPGSRVMAARPFPPLPAPARAAILLFSYIPPLPPVHVARHCGREGPTPASGQTGSSRLRDSDARLPPGGQSGGRPGHALSPPPFPARRPARPHHAAIPGARGLRGGGWPALGVGTPFSPGRGRGSSRGRCRQTLTWV